MSVAEESKGKNSFAASLGGVTSSEDWPCEKEFEDVLCSSLAGHYAKRRTCSLKHRVSVEEICSALTRRTVAKR
jgi:hypothetical protein